MSFVNELIPEAEKEKFAFPVFTRPDGSKPTLWKWTIDRERAAFLVFTRSEGGGYEGTPLTKHFVLSWNGFLINLSAEPLGASRSGAGIVMSWQIHSLNLPAALQDRKDEVIHLIKESFSAMGDIYDGDQYEAVNVELDLSSSRGFGSQK